MAWQLNSHLSVGAKILMDEKVLRSQAWGSCRRLLFRAVGGCSLSARRIGELDKMFMIERRAGPWASMEEPHRGEGHCQSSSRKSPWGILGVPSNAELMDLHPREASAHQAKASHWRVVGVGSKSLCPANGPWTDIFFLLPGWRGTFRISVVLNIIQLVNLLRLLRIIFLKLAVFICLLPLRLAALLRCCESAKYKYFVHAAVWLQLCGYSSVSGRRAVGGLALNVSVCQKKAAATYSSNDRRCDSWHTALLYACIHIHTSCCGNQALHLLLMHESNPLGKFPPSDGHFRILVTPFPLAVAQPRALGRTVVCTLAHHLRRRT